MSCLDPRYRCPEFTNMVSSFSGDRCILRGVLYSVRGGAAMAISKVGVCLALVRTWHLTKKY